MSLNFVPAVNIAGFNVEDNTVFNPQSEDDSSSNESNNGTNTTNSTNSTNETNSTTNDTVTIIYPEFNYLDYGLYDIGEFGDGIKRSVWHDELEDYHHKYEKCTYDFLNWTDKVAQIADETYANGTNNYSSDTGGKFQHVPIKVMKRVNQQFKKIDAYEFRLRGYYSNVGITWTNFQSIAAIVSSLGIAACAALSTLIFGTTAAATAAAPIEPTAPGLAACFAGKGAIIMNAIAAIVAASVTGPAIGIKASIDNNKGDIDKIDADFCLIKGDVEFEVPYIGIDKHDSNPGDVFVNIPVADVNPNDSSGFTNSNGSVNGSVGKPNPLAGSLNGSVNGSILNNDSKNVSPENVNVVYGSEDRDDSNDLTVFECSLLHKQAEIAVDRMNKEHPPREYIIKDWKKYDAREFTYVLDIIKPHWNPKIEWDPPSVHLSWKFWETLEDVGEWLWYAMEYAGEWFIYVVVYFGSWVAYIISYVALVAAYTLYWIGCNIVIACENIPSYISLKSDAELVKQEGGV
jgi:hypothetical protein